jgi:tetratricopeptide (TPR) repeat protein
MGDTQKVPPAPHRGHREIQILEEVPPSLAVVLWQSLRHLWDWGQTPPSRWAALFHPQPTPWVLEKRRAARAEAPELDGALSVLFQLTGSPSGASTTAVAIACVQIAEWSEQRQYMHSAVEFTEAAAMVEPREPRRANAAGRINRNSGDFARADTWFERGIALARELGDRIEFTRGHLGAGILCMISGRETRARKHLNRASNVAMKEGHEWLAAEAQHDLFHFMTVRGHYAEAELHARRALRWYPKHHARFPLFVADVAFLFVCERHFSASVALLTEVLRIVVDPGARSVISALLARALAGAGRWKESEQERRRVTKMLEKPCEWEAAARWNLAEAERAAGLWDTAEANAKRALEHARARRDSETEQFARNLLDQIAGRVPAPAELIRADDAFANLLNILRGRLSEWAPTRRGRTPNLTRREWAA